MRPTIKSSRVRVFEKPPNKFLAKAPIASIPNDVTEASPNTYMSYINGKLTAYRKLLSKPMVSVSLKQLDAV